MTPGRSRLSHSLCRNLPPIDLVEDELTRDPGPVGGHHSDSISSTLSYNPIPALISAPVLALIPTLVATNDLFKKFMKTYKETNQGPKQLLAEYEQFFKAKVPKVYYGKSHMDYYHFCQRCIDYFETVGAIGTNQTPFATSFFSGNISVRWVQFKRYNRGLELTPITWTEFKAFLPKNWGESKSFVDSIWRKLKRDSQYQLEEV